MAQTLLSAAPRLVSALGVDPEHDQHRAACVASSAYIFQRRDVRGLQGALHEHLTKPITGTVLGTRIIWPDSREQGEKIAWYVGGDDGCLYYCDREFGNKQPFAKSDRVSLERWDADSGEGAMTLDKNSEVKVSVIIEESLRPE